MSRGRVIQSIFELRDRFTPGLRNIRNGSAQYRRELRDLKKTGAAAFKTLAVGITALGAAGAAGLTAVSIKSMKLASDFEEMQSKFDTVFGHMSSEAEKWSKNFQDAVGGSRNEIKGMLADSQDMLTGFGATTEEGFQLATMFQSLGTDLASFGNLQGGAAEGVERLRKGLLGEHENLKAMGIVINETVLAQELASRGDQRKLKDLTELEKIQLRYEAAVKQSTNAIGDAAKTSGSFANQARNLKGRLSDAFTDFGVRLLPTATQGINFLVKGLEKTSLWINNVLDRATPMFSAIKQYGIDAFNSIKNAIEDNMEKFGVIALVFDDIRIKITDAFGSGGAFSWFIDTGIPLILGGIASILQIASDTYFFISDNWFLIGPLVYGIVGALTAYYAITKAITIAKYAWTAAQWALNTAMNANPIGIVALAIGGLIAVGVLLVKQWDNIALASELLWNGIVSGIEWGVNGVMVGLNYLIRLWDNVKLAGKEVWNGIVSAAEWGVNTYIKYVNTMLSVAMKAINAVIKAANIVPGVNIGEVDYSIKEVDFGAAKFDTDGQSFGFENMEESKKFDFGAAKFDTEGQSFQWKKPKDENQEFEDILKGFEKEQDIQIKTQQTSNNNLISSLDNNTDMLETTRGGGNTINVTVNGSDLTAEEIADKLVPRIERKLFA